MHVSAALTDKDRFRTAAAEFGMKMYNTIGVDESKNLVIAPCLAAFPLLPLLSIADGETRNEIKVS